MSMSGEARVIEDISYSQCLSYLTTKDVGRFALVVSGHPMIVPVNYAVDEGTIVVRSDVGTKVRSAPMAQVAFEVDEVNGTTQEGWSVLVSGPALDITDATDPESERLRQLPLDTWAPGPKNHWLKIVPKLITGRRLVLARHASKRA